MHAVFGLIVGEGSLKLFARDAFLQADNQGGIGIGIGDIPVFGFWFAAERGCDRGGRVHLQAEAILAIKPFDEDRERLGRIAARAEDVSR